MMQIINRWSDSDIIRMNDYINIDQKYCLFNIRPSYENHASCPAIAFYNLQTLQSTFYSTTTFAPSDVKIREPKLELNYHFSISNDNIDRFFDIFNTISQQEIENAYYDGESLKPIKLNTDIIKSKNITSHVMYNINYTRYEFIFKGGMIDIITYIKYLEYSIEYIKLIYGYNEKGEEINLLKHKIGDIVSLKEDGSKDLIVTNYWYHHHGNVYHIDYMINEILTDKLSPIIKYGKLLILTDKEITYSRNSRIDSILKND